MEEDLEVTASQDAGLPLTTRRLVMRDFSEGDLPDVLAMRGDPEVARFMDFAAETRAQTRAWLDGVVAHARTRPRDGYNLAVVHRATGRVIGWIGFGESSRYPTGSGEHGVGYMFTRAHWGQGYAAEALRAVIDYSFGALGAQRVSAWCWAENRASARVMEKVGMRFERRYERTEPKSGQATEAMEYSVGVDAWATQAVPPR
jgi:ribosomal-protein-alanine N-acetyltransferase